MRQKASLLQSNHQVEQHLHLAGQLAMRYSRRTGYDQDDLRQVGLISDRINQGITPVSTRSECAV